MIRIKIKSLNERHYFAIQRRLIEMGWVVGHAVKVVTKEGLLTYEESTPWVYGERDGTIRRGSNRLSSMRAEVTLDGLYGMSKDRIGLPTYDIATAEGVVAEVDGRIVRFKRESKTLFTISTIELQEIVNNTEKKYTS